MPIGVVVTVNPEIRSPNNFQIVRQAWVSHGKIVSGKVRLLGIPVDVWSVGIVKDLGIAVVLHHDQENVVQSRNTLWYGTLLTECSAPYCKKKYGDHTTFYFHNICLLKVLSKSLEDLSFRLAGLIWPGLRTGQSYWAAR